MSHTQPQSLVKTISTSVSNINNTNKKTPTVISVSSTTFICYFVSLSLFSFSFFFLSFKDTSFWFFLSNAIIFFIAAADSDTFRPSRPLHDFYDEYVRTMRSRTTTTAPLSTSTITTTPLLHSTTHIYCPSTTDAKESTETPLPLELPPPEPNRPNDKVSEKPRTEWLSRKVSERSMVLAGGGKKRGVQRSKTVVTGTGRVSGDLLEISDEELNRRVEEFIRRINREFRLQEMRELGGRV